MNDAAIHPGDQSQLKIDIANGAILKSIGLDKETLRIGLDVARNHMQRGAFREAFEVYTTMILCDPLDVDFQIGLANCALYLNENALALQSAATAIVLAPGDARGYFLSARSYLALGAVKQASDDLHEAINLASQSRDDAVLAQALKLYNGIKVLEN